MATTRRQRWFAVVAALLAAALVLLLVQRAADRTPVPAPAMDREAAGAAAEPVNEAPHDAAATTTAPVPDSELRRPAVQDDGSIVFVVLDDARAPVEGATVELWPARAERAAAAPGVGEVAWLGRAAGPPSLRATTDADGRCTMQVESDLVYAAASHADFGRSVLHGVGRKSLGAERQVRLWLLRPATVHGRVFGVDGAPAPHAAITVQPTSGGGEVGRFLPLGPIAADGAGRFAFEAAVGTPCLLHAVVAGKATQRHEAVVRDGLEVDLFVQGAFVIRGRAVDALGVPVPMASVEAWLAPEVPGAPAGTPERRTPTLRRTNAEAGAFELVVPQSGTYLVAASAVRDTEPWGGSPVEVRVTLAERRPSVDLVLSPGVPIRGSVHATQDSPMAVRKVTAWAADGSGTQLVARTAADGTFELAVAPGRLWWLQCDGGEKQKVPSGAQDVVLNPPATAATAAVTGVVFAPDGSPVFGPRIGWSTGPAAGVPSYAPASGATKGNRFSVRLPASAQSLVVSSDDPPLASSVVALASSQPTQHVVVHLQPTVDLPVRVLVGSLPARGLEVVLQGGLTLGGVRPRRTDATGAVRFERIAPGPAKLVVRRGFEVLGERTVEVVRGENTEVVLYVVL